MFKTNAHHEGAHSEDLNIFYPVPTVANDPAFKILLQQFDCVSATSRIAWTTLNSTRFAWRDAEQEFARRLAVLSDLLILARLIAPAYTTRNSTRVKIPNCTV